MKKSFVCSVICQGGIVGGSLSIDEKSITYKTNKLTVDSKYRNLVLPLIGIRELSWEWIVFPVATLYMTNGEQYKFIIFNKKGFNEYFEQVKQI